MSLLTEYRTSLKAIEVEELLDLIFFRPLAFVFVLAVYRTPLTPNAVTVLAAIVGVAASVWMGIGTGNALLVAALLLILYNVLDCSDGMLARLQRSGSRMGRILDGAADYIVTVAFYTGIGIGFASQSSLPGAAWVLTVAAGLSNALHSGLVDFYRNRFLDYHLDRVSVLGDDLEEFRRDYQNLRTRQGRLGEKFLLWFYLQYSTLQRVAVAPRARVLESLKIEREVYVCANRRLMRWWTFLGPTTELALLILGCLAGRIEIFLLTIVIFGNALALVLKLLQDRTDRLLAAGRT